MALSREDILQADDLEREEVEVEEWGGPVCIRVLRGDEQGFLEDISEEQLESEPLRFRNELLARCLCDEDGERLFSDDEIDKLTSKSGAVLNRLGRIAADINGFNAEAVEGAAGN